ncbi:potassium transporter [Deltaproteobacteria bacterium Smac51]|nr:potassium transporter [Deltaproteobacteria bacterium Smac51]
MMRLAVKFRLIFYMCGWMILLLAASLLLPLIPALIYDDGTAMPFLISSGATALVGGLLIFQGHGHDLGEARSRDGLATVGIVWLMIGLMGALPYWLTGSLPGFWDGVFESFSGFSTTGATVVTNIEALPNGILFWRCLTHWLGGMGIIVLMLAVLPFFGISGVQLFKNESSLGQQKIRPRVAQTAKTLWLIYISFTILLAALLMVGGLDWFDSLCHTFSAMATGGFANKNASIGHYDSPYVEVVLTIFITISSINFALYYQAAKGDWKALFKNTESRVFIGIIVVASLLVSASLTAHNYYDSMLDTVREAFFQVVSIISTTGFITTDWAHWPHFSQGVLFVLFFVGGCSGSTSGGLKCIRWILLFKGVYRTLRQHIHPRAVIPIRLGGQAVPESVMSATWAFCAIYFMVVAVSTLALAAMDLDLLTALSASASALGNVGIGLGAVGPADNFGHLPWAAKGILSFCMFMGRLEFFSLMILFLPEFWKK